MSRSNSTTLFLFSAHHLTSRRLSRIDDAVVGDFDHFSPLLRILFSSSERRFVTFLFANLTSTFSPRYVFRNGSPSFTSLFIPVKCSNVSGEHNLEHDRTGKIEFQILRLKKIQPIIDRENDVQQRKMTPSDLLDFDILHFR